MKKRGQPHQQEKELLLSFEATPNRFDAQLIRTTRLPPPSSCAHHPFHHDHRGLVPRPNVGDGTTSCGCLRLALVDHPVVCVVCQYVGVLIRHGLRDKRASPCTSRLPVLSGVAFTSDHGHERAAIMVDATEGWPSLTPQHAMIRCRLCAGHASATHLVCSSVKPPPAARALRRSPPLPPVSVLIDDHVLAPL